MAQDPDLRLGLDYWDTQDASLDGVLGATHVWLIEFWINLIGLAFCRWIWEWGE